MEYNLKSNEHAENCWHLRCLKHFIRAEGQWSGSFCSKLVIVNQGSITESPIGQEFTGIL